jgi:hypothetical protein
MAKRVTIIIDADFEIEKNHQIIDYRIACVPPLIILGHV